MYTSEKEGSSRASWVTKEKRIEVGRAVGFVESGRVVVVVVLVCGLWFVGGWWVQVSQAGRTPLVARTGSWTVAPDKKKIPWKGTEARSWREGRVLSRAQ